MSEFIVGLTGGIGSGKSAAAAQFRQHGIVVVDADIVAREVVAIGSPALKAIADKFGESMLSKKGALDRAAMRQHIFDHPTDQAWLNQLLHPAIRKRMFEQCESATSPYVVLEVPLLVEGGLNKHVHRVAVVDVPEETQVARASTRDTNTESQIRAIMAAQASRQQRLDIADDVIDNSGSLALMQDYVSSLHHKYLQLSSAHLAKTN